MKIADDWKKLAASTFADQDIEKAFLDQAYVFIQNKATPLMRDPYKLGFEIVFKNDANTKMVGIFVFRINKELLYAPVFFINGAVKGTDLLYRHGDKKFVCLTNDWCQYLLSLESYREGRPIEQDMSEGTKGLNLKELTMPPGHTGGNKMASYNEVVSLNEGLPTVEDLLDEFEKRAYEFQHDKGSILKDFIMEDGGYAAVDMLTKAAEGNIGFAQKLIDQVGLENVMPEELNEETRNHKNKFAGIAFKKAFTGKAAKHGFKVIDNRKKIIKKVYKNEGSIEKSSPITDKFMKSFSGALELLKDDGTSSSHKAASVTDSDKNLLLFSENGWDMKSISDLYVVKEAAEEDIQFPYSNEIDMNKWYSEAAFDENGKYASLGEPFYTEKKLESLSIGVDRYKTKSASGAYSTLYHDMEQKFVACGPREKIACASEKSFNNLARSAGMKEVKVEPRGNYFVVSSYKEVSPEMSKMASLAYLMAELDLGEEASTSILDKAASRKVSFYYTPLEKAGGKPCQEDEYFCPVDKVCKKEKDRKEDIHEKKAGMRFQNVPEFYAGFDEDFNVPSEKPEEAFVVADRNDNEGPEPRVGDRMKFNGPKDLESHTPDSLVQMAGEDGQSSLFEHGLVGSLVNTFDSTIMIDKYMSSLEDGLDKLGRIIFLFYWKPNDFSQLYGSDDQSSLENKLISNFKSFGDLVLELLKKTQSHASGAAMTGSND